MRASNVYFKSAVLVLLTLMIASALIGSGIAPSAYNLIQNAAVSVTQRSTLNFVNGGCVDNAGTRATDCTFLTTAPANFVCSFTTQTSVTCNHNLNTTAVIVSVYDAASPPNLIIPTTEKITDANNVTVTFSVAQSGKVVVAGSSGSGGGGGGGTPGGSATQWQYNNSGAFGGLIGTSIIPQIASWSVINNSNITIDDFGTNFLALNCPATGSIALSGIFQNLGASNSYTIISRFTVQALNDPGSTGDIEGNLTITDGTKYITFEVLDNGAAAQNPILQITTYSNATTQVATIHGPTSHIIGNIATLKIVGDATNRTYYYWSSGAYVQFYQEAIGTFLTETKGGISIFNLNAINQATASSVVLNYWSNTTP